MGITIVIKGFSPHFFIFQLKQILKMFSVSYLFTLQVLWNKGNYACISWDFGTGLLWKLTRN